MDEDLMKRKAKLLLAYFGHRLTPGLPGASGLWLYDVPEPPVVYLYNPWGTQQTKVTSILDTTSTILITL